MSSRVPLLSATVVEVELLTPRVRRVVVDVPHDYAWEPGQHLALRVRADSAPRYYSIASAPPVLALPGAVWPAAASIPSASGETVLGRLELVMGESSEAAPLDVADRVLLSMPTGERAVPRDHRGPTVLVGVGTGVAPLRAVVQERASLGLETLLLVGSRTLEEALFHGEFEALAAHGLLRYLPVLSQPSGEWSGLVGRVQEHLGFLEGVHTAPGAHFAVCGSRAMVDDVVTLLLASGAAHDRIFAEGY